ncbi:helix-turn-helix transcriptional regulator [Streptomyces sp. NPDC053499]|uniref:helix-turn-helix domain-containing protein n=1 Tax=Streptomyces sp. NPDC053499 TaxID=3365707 RepID=UPI00205FB7E8|nr:helix-turn-helix transcriptional regulator [Streptomyces sp. 891-h]
MDHDRSRALDALTPREREVLGVLAAGEGNRALARRLGIAERTVKAHLTSITRKLGLRSRIEAVILARECAGDVRPQGGPRPTEGVNGMTSLA